MVNCRYDTSKILLVIGFFIMAALPWKEALAATQLTIEAPCSAPGPTQAQGNAACQTRLAGTPPGQWQMAGYNNLNNGYCAYFCAPIASANVTGKHK